MTREGNQISLEDLLFLAVVLLKRIDLAWSSHAVVSLLNSACLLNSKAHLTTVSIDSVADSELFKFQNSKTLLQLQTILSWQIPHWHRSYMKRITATFNKMQKFTLEMKSLFAAVRNTVVE